MSSPTIIEDTRFNVLASELDSGTGTFTSAAIDVKLYEAICFICQCGTVGGGGTVTLTAQYDSDEMFTNPTDLASVTATATNKACILDLITPDSDNRYWRAKVVRSGAASTINVVYALQYAYAYKPVTQSADVVASSNEFISV